MLALLLYTSVRESVSIQHRVRAVVLLSSWWAFGDASFLGKKQQSPHFFILILLVFVGGKCKRG